MSNVTKWERWNEPEDGKQGHWALNHLEDGHATGDSPTAFRGAAGEVYKRQRDSWARGTWRKTFGVLEGDRHVFVANP